MFSNSGTLHGMYEEALPFAVLSLSLTFSLFNNAFLTVFVTHEDDYGLLSYSMVQFLLERMRNYC
jgi:uncharacterized ion transporter superfamily protein YfcC